jgi:hypothetical protein
MNARNVDFASTEKCRNENETYSGRTYEYGELLRKR